MNKRRMRSVASQILSRRKTHSSLLVAPIAVAMTGCSEVDYSIYLDTDSCKSASKISSSQCDVAYKEALREARRTAEKFSNYTACTKIYRECRYIEEGNLGWEPKMHAFLVAKLTPENRSDYPFGSQFLNGLYYQPLFALDWPSEKLTFADRKEVGDLRDLSDISYVSYDYMSPLPNAAYPFIASDVPAQAQAGLTSNNQLSGSNDDDWGTVETLAAAYVASEVIDELGDHAERKHKEKTYKERLRREQNQLKTASTSPKSATPVKSASTSPNSSTLVKTSQAAPSQTKVREYNTQSKPRYADKPKVKTSSRGGFGKTSAAKVSWGG
ncbi:DUF1190 domain-containing protein [Veronia pacifica]|uniref:DUF1190 domain-containing protein n=1 Tax=Veronia pacifica TaxID=1080227 RepID=A0A1C3ESQ2_9GAMM|nr:DUF1190 domain-containing protein [Veronia pacifica]ODA36278.1 hypothetical protein A8L45_01380 [Veronia pacifica]